MVTKFMLMKKLLLSILFVALAATSFGQTATFSVTTTPCNHNGVIATTFTGVTPPLTVTYYTTGTMGGTIVHTGVTSLTDVLTSYSGGPLNVNATDGSGAIAWGWYTGMSPFTYSITSTPAVCPALGTDNVTVTGGTPPYTYSWFDEMTSGIVGTSNPISLPAGMYGVEITDAAGCVYGSFDQSDSGTIASITSYCVVVTPTTASCTNGTATATVAGGGVPPYTYLWSNGATTSGITGLIMGSYNVTVTDAVGCTSMGYAYVNQSITITVPVTPTPATCIASNGAVIGFGSGGVPPYSYLWSNGATTQSQTGLAAGSYGVTATDANGCSGTASTTIVVNPLPVPTATNTGPYCISGSIQLNAGGGSGYTWSGPNSYTSAAQNPSIANAAATMSGAYNVTVTDTHGCSATATTNVVVNSNPVANAGPDGVITCANPQLALNAAAIAAGENYSWGGPGIVSGGTTATPAVNVAGTYTLTVTDANHCTATDAAVITSTITPPNINIGAGGTLTCVVSSVTLTVSSTTPGAAFIWSNGPITGSNPVTIAGTYVVTLTDPANGCTASANAVVATNTAAPNANAGPDKIIPCSSNVIALSGSSTTVNATFSWSGAAIASGTNTTSPNVSLPGVYTLTVTDPANGCTASAFTNVMAAAPPTLTSIITDNPCPQISIGQIDVQVAGGEAPFGFLWSNNAVTQSLSGLRGGTYTVTVTDVYGCTANASYVVAEGSFGVQALQDATINLGQNVQLGGLVSGGTGQYAYMWTPDYNMSCLTCLSPVATPYQTMIYSLQVTDTNGCIASDTIKIIVNPLHNIFIPNAFSPNGDGNNDYFSIKGDLNLIIFFEVKIFDRWGEKVFDSNNPYFEWDGTFKGVLETPQVFVYEIKATFLDHYTRNDYKGSLTILR